MRIPIRRAVSEKGPAWQTCLVHLETDASHIFSRQQVLKLGGVDSSLTSTSQSPVTSKCPSQCLGDPYVKPGMILWGKDQFGKETRYVPFPSDGGRLPVMRTRDLDKGGTAYWNDTTEVMDLAVPAYTQAIKSKQEDVVGFARNKLALFIGQSTPAWPRSTVC